MATRHVLAALAAEAHARGLPDLHIESTGGVTAAERVAAGEYFDLVFLADGALSRLGAQRHVIASSRTPIVLSSVAAAVPDPSSESAPSTGALAFANADAMRAALLDADRIGYSTGPSGDALVRMIEEWGLADVLGSRLVQARAGVPVASLLADGEVDLGFQQRSELVGAPSITILGVLPPECAIDTVFSGAISWSCIAPDDAQALLDFFSSDEAAAIISAHHFAIPPTTPGR